jgi:iron(III) transport system permease protein
VQRFAQLKSRQESLALPLLALLTAVLVVGPLVVLVRTSLTPAGAMPFASLALTLQNYATIIADPVTYRLLWNTLVYAGGTVLVGLVLALALAWLSERTDLPGGGAIRTAMFVFIALPPLALTFGWILLLNSNNGALNVFLTRTLGLPSSPFDIYSMEMMIAISGLMLAPTMYTMLGGVLRNMDPQLESAAAAAGSHPFAIMRNVTLPLLTPGLLSVAIYSWMLMVQVFDTPLVIGLTAQVPVLSTRIYSLASAEGGVPRYGLSAAFGVVLLLLALVLMWGYFRTLRVSERFRVVTGKGFRPRRVRLGVWRAPAAAFVVGYFALLLLPLLILVWTSLLPFYAIPSLEALGRATLANYMSVTSLASVQRAIGNTIVLGLFTATATMVLASLISWFSVRSRSPVARWVDTMAFTPMAVPGIVMGIAVMMLYIQTPLYGTIWIIALAQVTLFLAFGTRSMNGALIQIHKDLENAAAASGARWLTVLRTVLLPLLLPHFLTGWLWVVAHSFRDLTIPLLLRTTDNVVVSTSLLQLWNTPNFPGASALAVLMILGLMVLVIPVQIYAARHSR